MADMLGPGTLRALATALQVPATQAEIDALVAHADAWGSEQADHVALAEELALAQKRVEVLEQDRKWWQDNAIKRRKRSEARRSGSAPRRGKGT
jgi:sulfur relay (sulfurtransferase) DsrC/TusE family protein